MDNLRGSALMVTAMAAFAIEDAFIKRLGEAMSIGQLLALIGCGGTIIFAVLARANARPVITPAALSRPVVSRNLGEMAASAAFVAALVLSPLSSAAAILQATPLAVTLGAALVLGEGVGWRRWLAIATGFAGVVLVIQPGLAGFVPASLLALVAVAGLALRDLASRYVPASVSGLQLSAWAFASLAPTGLAVMAVSGAAPEGLAARESLLLLCTLAFSATGYYAIVAATRTGEVSVVVPFRYTRLVFAMILGMAIFGERPGVLMLIGAGLIVGAGLYTIAREARRSRRRAVQQVPADPPI
jgi:drug/metabolite transporter (DMT)-like permease